MNPSAAHFLFDGKRTLIWLGLSLLHFFWGIFCVTPLVWTSLYMTMVFNPHAGYREVDESVVRIAFNQVTSKKRITLSTSVSGIRISSTTPSSSSLLSDSTRCSWFPWRSSASSVAWLARRGANGRYAVEGHMPTMCSFEDVRSSALGLFLHRSSRGNVRHDPSAAGSASQLSRVHPLRNVRMDLLAWYKRWRLCCHS